MTANKPSSLVSGKTIRLSWTDGPTKGTTQEHMFFADGTVEWHWIDADKVATGDAKKAAGKPDATPERPKYAALQLTDEVCLVSYLSKSGYTLTVALNFADHSTAGFASNDKTWVPVRGKFEIAGK